MEKTAIELLKNLANATKMLIRDAEVVNSYYEQNDYAEHEMPLGSPNPDSVPIESRKCSEIIADIDAYLSSPPSEKANELIFRIRAYIMREYCDGCDPEVVFEMTGEQAAREIEAFGQWWISVKNKLPLYGQPVICTRDTGDKLIFEALIWDEEEERYMGKTFNNITHWMPLPPAPEAQGEKNGKDI